MKYYVNTVSVELNKSEMLIINIALSKYASELRRLGTYENEYTLQRLCRQFESMNKTELKGVIECE